MKMRQKHTYVRASLPTGKAPQPVKTIMTEPVPEPIQVPALADTPKEKSRQAKTMSFEIYTQAADELGIKLADLTEKLGYSRSSHSHWAEQQAIPHVAGIACKALCEEQKLTAALAKAKEAKTLLLKIDYITKDQCNSAVALLQALGLKVTKIEI